MEPEALTPEEADYCLWEWSQWVSGDAIGIGYPKSTPFGRCIKPDPAPARVPIDEQRALRTDRAIAQLNGRRRFWLKVHYLDHSPIDAKARRLHVGRAEYKARIEGLCGVIALLLDPPKERLEIRTRVLLISAQAGSLPKGDAEAQGPIP